MSRGHVHGLDCCRPLCEVCTKQVECTSQLGWAMTRCLQPRDVTMSKVEVRLNSAVRQVLSVTDSSSSHCVSGVCHLHLLVVLKWF